MSPIRLPILVAAAGLAVCLSAQEPVAPTQPPAASAPDSPQKGADALIRDLGSPSYRTRLGAERALRDLGKQAVPALQQAAEQGDDPEVQWRARRLLRQIERGGERDLVERGAAPEAQQPEPQDRQGRRPALRRGPEGGVMRDQFESLFERFEREFGIDIPRARFFDDDFFRDLQEQLQSGQGRSQGMTVQIGPDGAVRVETKERNEKGEVESKVYEAPDMETFQQKYPGVLQQNGLGFGAWPWRGSLRAELGPVLRGFDFDADALRPRVLPFGRAPAAGDDAVEPAPAPPPAGRRLGVGIRSEISADLRAHLGLEDGEGLLVESVQSGSLAESLGLAAGDIVTRIGGAKIGSPADVQQALGAIEKGATVEVQFVRKGVAKTASATKTEAAEQQKGGRLEPRRAKAETIR